jgi:hypothetical protein
MLSPLGAARVLGQIVRKGIAKSGAIAHSKGGNGVAGETMETLMHGVKIARAGGGSARTHGSRMSRAAIITGALIALIAMTQSAWAQIPTINLQETCKAASGVMLALMGGSTTANDLQICLDTENKAREQIIKDWGAFDAGDRASCIQPRVYLPSYVEWLTCFEMNKVVREARKTRNVPADSSSATVTLPRVQWGSGY